MGPIGRLSARLRPGSGRGRVRFGSLNRTTPFDRYFGFTRGQPVDRVYIERFYERQGAGASPAIRGDVLEVGESLYTRRFGAPEVGAHVIDIDESNPDVTLLGDLSKPQDLPAERFDCIICAQTLMFIYDIDATVESLHRMLRPGGAALVTLSGIAQIGRAEMQRHGDFWRFTDASARRLFEQRFDPGEVEVETYGNVLTASAFLYGLAADELPAGAYDSNDRDYQLIISVVARKRG